MGMTTKLGSALLLLLGLLALGCGGGEAHQDAASGLPPYPDHDVETLWTYLDDTAGYDEARGVAFDAAGNVLVVGTVEPAEGASSALLVVKLDRDGQVLLRHTLGGEVASGAQGHDVAPLGDDTLVLGSVAGELVLLRLDEAGQQVWSRSWSDTRAFELATTAEGDVVLAGTTKGDGGWGTWLIRLGGDGETQWERYAPTAARDYLGLVVEPGGSIAVLLHKINGPAEALHRYSSDGELLVDLPWDCGDRLAVAPSGRLASVVTLSSGERAPLCVHAPDLTLLWRGEVARIDSKYVQGAGLTFGAGGMLLVTGNSFDSSQGQFETWVRSYDQAGALLWDHSDTSDDGNGGTDIAVDPDGRIVTAGHLGGQGLSRSAAVVRLLRD